MFSRRIRAPSHAIKCRAEQSASSTCFRGPCSAVSNRTASLLRVLAMTAAGFAAPLFAVAQNSPTSNSDSNYQQLRNIGLSGEAISVKGLDLKRDAATFHLRSGTVCFVPPVQGKITGAVFTGDGTMSLDPPTADERRSLKLLTKSDEFAETFNRFAMRFTDSTYEEIKKAGTPAPASCDAGPLRDSQNITRRKLHYNLDARILQDVLRPDSGGLFVAFINGDRYGSKFFFMIDPNGAIKVAPEEVELMTYGESNPGIWAAFRMSDQYKSRLGSRARRTSEIHIEQQDLDTTIEANAHLFATAKTSLVALTGGSRVLPFDLYKTLRVQRVLGPTGQPLAFVQEDKNDDPDFYVIFPNVLAANEKYTITTTYDGKDAVINEENGNYYPVARENWYPARATCPFADRSSFHMIFRTPKGTKMAASGSLISEKDEGGQNVTEWHSDAAQPVAGFQFGHMKEEQAKLSSPDFLVAVYANDEPPAWVQRAMGASGFKPSTVAVMKEPLSEAQFAIQLYTDYVGPLPFKRLSLTQQTPCDYGQSWPGLVWLPTCSFYARESPSAEGGLRGYFIVGSERASRGYWVVVTPHEAAHQWWGQLVGFNSYRDEWMSEGFADFSASLFLKSAYDKKVPWLYGKFWNDERQSIVERNNFGFRAIDVGPITMGYRLNNGLAGFNVYRELIYPKGAYIVQMVRMMMWSPQTGDQRFKEMMQDFVKTFGGRSATTEDFKATVERHMTRDMNIGGNGKMDWFFNEYVYGTALPSYQFNANFEKGPAGGVVMSYVLAQSGVDDNFVMLVPIYLELADGRTVFLGRVIRKGNTSSNGKITLKGVTDIPKHAMINYHDDALASN